MFDSLKEWILKKFGGTFLNKFIRNGLMVAATWLAASDTSLCGGTDICKQLAGVLGENADQIVDGVSKAIMFFVGFFMSMKAAKAETVGKKVLKG